MEAAPNTEQEQPRRADGALDDARGSRFCGLRVGLGADQRRPIVDATVGQRVVTTSSLEQRQARAGEPLRRGVQALPFIVSLSQAISHSFLRGNQLLVQLVNLLGDLCC